MRNIPSHELDSKDKNHNIKQRLSNEELSRLYPKPKTYDEKLEDRKTIQAKILAKQPKHVVAHVALRLFIVTSLGALVITTAPQIIMWNVISGVFFVVLLALLWLGIVAWQYSEISSMLYKKDLSPGSFFGFYIFIVAPLMIISCYIINEQARGFTLLLIYSILFSVHLLCVYLLISSMSRQQ